MRLIELDAAINALETIDCSDGVGISVLKCDAVDDAVTVIKALPTVDAVPVVRCKNCKHYQFADNRAFGFPVKRCEWTGFEDVDDEDFCSRGERKDGKHGKDDSN